jgi:hypothetical protein
MSLPTFVVVPDPRLTTTPAPAALAAVPPPLKNADDWALSRSQLCPQYPLPGHLGVTSTFSPDGYRQAVARAVEYVHAGDCFQVNLSQRLLAPRTEHPLDLFARLRQRNAAPFAGYFDLGNFAVASASPERFLRVEHGDVETRPIKGTRPRGATPAEDEALRQALLGADSGRALDAFLLGHFVFAGPFRRPNGCRASGARPTTPLASDDACAQPAALSPKTSHADGQCRVVMLIAAT